MEGIEHDKFIWLVEFKDGTIKATTNRYIADRWYRNEYPKSIKILENVKGEIIMNDKENNLISAAIWWGENLKMLYATMDRDNPKGDMTEAAIGLNRAIKELYKAYQEYLGN